MRWIMLAAGLAGCAAGGQTVVSSALPQPFCTRTLGVAECFADPAALPDRPEPLADTPVRVHVACRNWWQDGGLLCSAGQPARP